MADGYAWNPDKNRELLERRGLSFIMVLEALAQGGLLDDLEHPSKLRQNQRTMIVKVKGEICVVPYVKDGDTKFLKTIFPNRDYRDKYGGVDG